MTILDAITSSPFNVFFSIVIGIGLAYLYCRKPSSSTSASSTSSSGLSHPTRAFSSSSAIRSSVGVGVIDVELHRAIAQIERQERDMIRQEQDEAYQQSLRADREKQLKREEEIRHKEAKEREELKRKAQLEQLHNRLMKLKCDIKDKLPIKSVTPNQLDIVKLVFKLPDGSRVKQEFYKSDKVKHLYWFVFSVTSAPLQFKLTTNFPKRDLPGRPPLPEDFEDHSNLSLMCPVEPNCEQTLEEAGLTETQIIFVYDLEA